MEALVIAHDSSSPDIILDATLQHVDIPLVSSGDLFVNLRAALPQTAQPNPQADIVILIDTSSSMSMPAKNRAAKIDTLKTVLNQLLNNLSSRSRTSPGVNMTFVDLVKLQPIATWFDISDKAAVQRALASIASLTAAGGERPDEALQQMCKMIQERDAYRRNQVVSSTCIVLSDGQGGYDLEEFLPHYNATVRSKPLTLYGIGFGEDVEAAKLTETAMRTGGRFCFGDTGSDLRFIFEDLVSKAQAVVCSRRMTIAPGQDVSILRLHTEFPPFQKDARLMGQEKFDLGNASAGSETNILLRAELATCTIETKQHIATVRVQFNNSAGKPQLAGVNVFVRRVRTSPGASDMPPSGEFTTDNPVKPTKDEKSNPEVIKRLLDEVVRRVLRSEENDKEVVDRAQRVIEKLPVKHSIKQEMKELLDGVQSASDQMREHWRQQTKHLDGIGTFFGQEKAKKDDDDGKDGEVDLEWLEGIIEAMKGSEKAAERLENICNRIVQKLSEENDALRKEAEANRAAQEQHKQKIAELLAKDNALKQQNEAQAAKAKEQNEAQAAKDKEIAALRQQNEAQAAKDREIAALKEQNEALKAAKAKEQNEAQAAKDREIAALKAAKDKEQNEAQAAKDREIAALKEQNEALKAAKAKEQNEAQAAKDKEIAALKEQNEAALQKLADETTRLRARLGVYEQADRAKKTTLDTTERLNKMAQILQEKFPSADNQ